jgi:hypothetical protein
MGRLCPRVAASLCALVTLVGLACVFDSPENPDPLTIDGAWRFTEAMVDPLRSLACTDTGVYNISQVRDSFFGTYQQTGVCTSPQGAFSNRQRGTVTSGRIVGNRIQFHVPENCDYDGALSGSPPAQVAGKTYCILRDASGTVVYNYEGAWQAIR